MYETEIKKMRELTERVKNGGDISYEEADWISQWVVPDDIACKFFKFEGKNKTAMARGWISRDKACTYPILLYNITDTDFTKGEKR